MPRKSKKINIRLVAEEAGVSLASVSRVLNNHPDVSEALRRQVMAVVEKIISRRISRLSGFCGSA